MKINKNISELKPSATLLINEKVKALREKGKKITHFGFGQSPFPVPRSIVQALKDNAHQKDYLPSKGLLELRKSISNFLKNKGYKARKIGQNKYGLYQVAYSSFQTRAEADIALEQIRVLDNQAAWILNKEIN